MEVYIPYTCVKGEYIYFRRVVPARLRQQIGKTEIKIRVGHRDRLPELMVILGYLSKMTIAEVVRVAKKQKVYDTSSIQMTDGAWDSIISAAAADRPDSLTPGRLAVLRAIDKMFGKTTVYKLDNVIVEFLDYKKKSGIGESSLKEYRTAGRDLVDFFGAGKDIATLTTQDVWSYLEYLNNQTQYQLTTKTNKKNSCSTIMSWIEAKGFVGHSNNITAPFGSFVFNPNTCTPPSRKITVISDADAVNIHKALLPEKKSDDPWHYWIFLLCLFHGARPGEICQLDTADIILNINGTPCTPSIYIADGSTKSNKNTYSKRLIPIHPVVLRKGLLSYVRKRQNSGAVKLFPLGERHPSNGYTQKANKFFSPFLADLHKNGKVSEKYTLDKCRKTFETKIYNLQLSDAETRIAHRITGRAVTVSGVSASVTRTLFRYYIGNDFTPDDMMPILQKVVYPGI